MTSHPSMFSALGMGPSPLAVLPSVTYVSPSFLGLNSLDGGAAATGSGTPNGAASSLALGLPLSHKRSTPGLLAPSPHPPLSCAVFCMEPSLLTDQSF